MKVLVTVKEVAAVEDDFEISGTEIESTYLDYDLNEWDDYAVEEAVQLAEAGDDVEVVAVTIGPERAEETIRMALAKGADRAVRVWDDAIEDTELLDVETKARLLAAVVEDEDPELVFSGVQANDDSFGATGIALAETLGFQWAAVVNDLDTAGVLDEGVASVRRELEGGVEELTDVELPAVLTIQTGINEPRYASLRGIRQAQSKEIAPKSLDDLGLDADVVASSLDITAMYEPETESDAEYIEGDAGEQASGVADVLRDAGVVGE
ncbi:MULTISPECIES: electron transfer flavoprotein subunit beta/FixA family protein [Halobacterium]|uniref:electron transfer flavoprotein subunit beta/FixA family protein n=1 Tax=Halobacterium TaxID=2239 RepID=UPI00196292C9|nr:MULTISPECIES: electron transfer flavoprotein subunit beta/FixA family protein [Halobacterium]MCF2165908.1 electron transfer flavoprotein subunit beta/FixA family protein [Halobacterium salinarum]MCF2167323.1 electron transfer flavoprotein subunit beta/FixA family protein [Halobacterium salinarum]MDL0127209.1 electron transfer flavoprotein subunit beta/FixA family protein [Halobacterium salinarum]MDL0133280.1 electron transfer flavoprotein subunit beta/FixA family protein [Halobacterium salin